MIKFTCGQCGHRIAIHRRHLGTAIICPDCQASTHPIAQHVQPAITRTKSAAGNAAATFHVCANCSQPIGRLQRLELWDNKLVCAPCHRRLSDETTLVARTTTSPTTTAVTVVRRERQKLLEGPTALADPLVHQLSRPFRGSLFGALVGLCVAAAALYGAMSLLKDVAGVITGLTIGALALLAIYAAVRSAMSRRDESGRARTEVGYVGGNRADSSRT